MNIPSGNPAPERLVDGFSRTIDYIRVSVTDRCNLKCFYCKAAGAGGRATKSGILSYEEIYFVLETARAFYGIKNVRLTGGEPLTRRGVENLIEKLRDGGLSTGLTTNGTLLGEKARSLKNAGLGRLNVSLDTLSAKRYREITGADISAVLSGIEAARKAGFDKITINAVAGAASESEAAQFLLWAEERNCDVKFIEEMPIGRSVKISCGSVERGGGQKNNFDFAAFERNISAAFGLVSDAGEGFGPGRYYRRVSGGSGAMVAFVSAVSKPFCEKCNRLRLTADGRLMPCLGHPDFADLKPLLRSNVPENQKRARIAETFEIVAEMKPENHARFARAAESFMADIGG